MVNPVATDVEAILPHRPPMLLLDRVEEDAGDRTVASWRVDPACPWLRDGTLDGAALVEVAAQTAAAGAGLRRMARGLPPEAGYLGAVSRFEVLRDVLAGQHLRCTVSVRLRVGTLVHVTAEVERVAGDAPGDAVARGELSLATSGGPDGDGA